MSATFVDIASIAWFSVAIQNTDHLASRLVRYFDFYIYSQHPKTGHQEFQRWISTQTSYSQKLAAILF
jgi:hypothetical protein